MKLVSNRYSVQIGRTLLLCTLYILSGCKGVGDKYRHSCRLENEAVWLARYWWTSDPRPNTPNLSDLAKKIQEDEGIVISINEWRAVKYRPDRTPGDADIIVYSTFSNNGNHLVIRGDASVGWVQSGMLPHPD